MILLISRTLPIYHFFRSRTSFCTAVQPYIMPYNFNFVRLLCRTRKKLYGRTSVFAPLVMTLTEFSVGHHLISLPRWHPISHKWLKFLQFSYSYVLKNLRFSFIVPLICLALKASDITLFAYFK